MVDSFNSLGHNTVVCRNNKNCNVGSLCTACTHFCEGCVTGSIKEGDVGAVKIYSVSTDMLCDTARFCGGNLCVSDSVKN